MRWQILITLLQKEVLRHFLSRAGISITCLLVLGIGALAFLTSGGGLSLAGNVDRCFVDYWQDGPWIEHLRATVPPELERHITFRGIEQFAAAGETIYYPAGAGAIQVRASGDGLSGPGGKVWFWYPGSNAAGLARYEAWFWRETARYLRRHGVSPSATVPALDVEHSSLEGSGDLRTAVIAALLIFPLFLTCVYLLSTSMCEERERGLLLAVALTPATPLEILAARALFCAGLGMTLATLAIGVSCPALLGCGWFWAVLPIAALGTAGVGATIGSLARGQRMASVAALGYMALVAGILSAGHVTGFFALSGVALEYHLPRIIHAILSGANDGRLALHVTATAVLALAWAMAATVLFKRRGWQ